MSPEKWDSLSIQDRVIILRKADPSMRDPRWDGLVNDMSNSRFEELTELQKAAVRELRNG